MAPMGPIPDRRVVLGPASVTSRKKVAICLLDSPLEGRVRCELVSEFLESIKKGSF